MIVKYGFQFSTVSETVGKCKQNKVSVLSILSRDGAYENKYCKLRRRNEEGEVRRRIKKLRNLLLKRKMKIISIVAITWTIMF